MISFETSPEKYRHWKLDLCEENVAFLTMDVQEDAPLRPEYKLKLNSYDLGVDIELADAVQRTCELMKKGSDEDARKAGGIDLPTIQKYINLWYSVSADLFGGEISTNGSNYFGASLKGRDREISYPEHKAKDQFYKVMMIENGALKEKEVPLRNAINEVLRDSYIEDCQRGCDRWNKVIEKAGLTFRLKLPSRRFHRQVGIYANHSFAPDGSPVSAEECERHRDEWLPNESDRAYVKTLMNPVYQPGKIAGWISAPERGISGRPFDFEYVRFESAL